MKKKMENGSTPLDNRMNSAPLTIVGDPVVVYIATEVGQTEIRFENRETNVRHPIAAIGRKRPKALR